MEEVQSWWEVPAVAHFFYVFRTPFNLFFFEIDELEAALLNIQDPDMSISLENMVTRLLQGCFDGDSVNEDNWEEKLHELFNDNFEDEKNPLGECYFPHLPPRSKIEILLKLCELRLDVEGALDEIKNVPSEDMQAKCIGKDSQNNTYWYFCNERLYKENSLLEKKVAQLSKNRGMKNNSNKIRHIVRERKGNNNNSEKPWSIACFTINDWIQLSNSFSKSKKSQDKELATSMKNHLPVLEERIAEKDRLLRKRFLELAPKRSSSRISKVEEKKRLEKEKAAEEARKAELKAEKERARKEALLLKQLKESRQKRAEERSRLIEERAERAKQRELMRDDENSSEEDSRNVPSKVSPVKNQRKTNSKKLSTKRKFKKESNAEEFQNNSYSKIRKKTKVSASNNSVSPPVSRRSVRTYSNASKQLESKIVNNNKIHNGNSPTNLLNSSISNADISLNNKLTSGVQCESQNSKKISSNDEFTIENSQNNNAANSVVKVYAKRSNCVKNEDLPSKKHSLNLSNYACRLTQASNTGMPPRISIYKSNVISNTSDMSKWNAPFDSKGQKVHILYKSSDSGAPKRIKLEQVNFRAVPPSMKSSLAKENHLYKPVQFITYGKIIPSSTMVKLEYKKPSNQPVSS